MSIEIAAENLGPEVSVILRLVATIDMSKITSGVSALLLTHKGDLVLAGVPEFSGVNLEAFFGHFFAHSAQGVVLGVVEAGVEEGLITGGVEEEIEGAVVDLSQGEGGFVEVLDLKFLID